MAFAILRFDKLKTSGQVSAAVAHHLRTIPTPNADPTRTAKNEIIAGSGLSPADVAALASAAPARRKDAVRGMGFVMTASPEWFKTGDLQAWKKASVDWLKTTFGDRVIFANLQLDESTPHLQGVILPTDEKGNLNAFKVFGKNELRNYQTSYSKAVQHLGLERGVEKSQARHTTIKEFYGALKADKPSVKYSPDLPVPGLTHRSEESLKEWRSAIKKQLHKDISPAFGQEAKAAAAGRIAIKKNEQLVRDSARKTEDSERWKERFYEQKERADMTAPVTLEEVIPELGLERDSKDKTIYRSQDGRKYSITLSKGLWNCVSEGNGGIGPLALIQHVTGCTKGKAFGWLREHFPPNRVAAAAILPAFEAAKAEVEAAPKTPFLQPMEHAPGWAAVRDYLVSKRKIAPAIVDDLHQQGLLYAQYFQPDDAKYGGFMNAVFIQRNPEGVPTGASIRGTGQSDYKGEAAGSQKQEGAFVIGNTKNPKRIVVVEAAIDAMAFISLQDQKFPLSSTLILSTGGSGLEGPEKWLSRHPQAEVILAQDNDVDGNNQAKRFESALPGRNVSRMKPKAKDWADDLKNAPAKTTTFTPSHNQDFKF